ncbi:fimbrial protein [Superficieibacter sp.]|uniref:fimbrial protein n=1 Tax=Superficieibacter sp. TaxID=2303322 RepID=UPI0028AC3AC2|nr:fimbrial protein [Superficieibacter sp.]
MRVRFIFLVGLFLAQSCLADVCQNVNGTASTIDYDLSAALTVAQDQPGETVQMARSQEVDVQAVCPEGMSRYGRTYRSYVTSLPVVETSGSWQYLKLDDEYLEGAMEIQDSVAGTIYPPRNYVLMGYDENVDQGLPFYIRDSNLVFQIKIVKPFIGEITIPLKTMFSVYVTTRNTDPLNYVVYNIVYSGSVTVPQSCEINAGQTILVDFGTLNSGGFIRAGQKPKGVRTRTFNVPVKCSGGDDRVSLSMRVMATPDSNFSQAIASDNADVGVVVADSQGRALTPNDSSSKVPFTTNAAGIADLQFQAYPVSTTGNTPAEGTFTSLASLRVDFD